MSKINGYIGIKPPSYKQKNSFKIEFNSSSARTTAINNFKENNINAIVFTPNAANKQPFIPSGIVIRDIPIGVTLEEVKAATLYIETVKTISLSIKKGWQIAHVQFNEKDTDLDLNNIWSIPIRKDSCHITP